MGWNPSTTRTVADPVLEDPGDVLLRVTHTAICGSDLHVYHGRETGLDEGTVMGHEFLGEVVEAGADVRGFPVGTTAVAAFTTSCGSCFYCGRDLTSRCVESTLFGWVEGDRGLHGGQAELVRVPLADSTLVAVPDGVPHELALLTGDVLPTGFTCAANAAPSPGDVLCVLGCGPVGLSSILGAHALGVERILAVDRVPSRLALAERFGAEPLPLDSGDLLERIREATDGRGADAVLEVVGSQAATRLAVDLLRPAASSRPSECTRSPSSPSPRSRPTTRTSPTARAARRRRAHMERMMNLVAERPDDVAAMISHRLPLSEGVRAYELFARKLDDCTKVVLSP